MTRNNDIGSCGSCDISNNAGTLACDCDTSNNAEEADDGESESTSEGAIEGNRGDRSVDVDADGESGSGTVGDEEAPGTGTSTTHSEL